MSLTVIPAFASPRRVASTGPRLGFIAQVNESYSDPEKMKIYVDAQRRFKTGVPSRALAGRVREGPVRGLDTSRAVRSRVERTRRASAVHGPLRRSHDIKEATYMRHGEG